MADDYENLRQQQAQQQERDNLWWLGPAAAGLGAIALGGYIFKSVGGQGGNIMANMLHFLGRPRGEAVNVDLLANASGMEAASGASGVRSFLSATFNLSKQQVQLGPLDVITDIGASLEVLGNTTGQVRELVASKVTEAINRRYVNYGKNASFFSDNLQRITFGEVINNEGTWRKLIGNDQWAVMKTGLERGLINADQYIDKNIYKTNKGYLRDLRLTNLVSTVKTSPEGVVERVPRIDLFGQAKVFNSLFGNRTIAARLTSSPMVKGTSYFIDGNVYAYTKLDGNITEHIVARNVMLRNTGDALEPIRAAREGRILLTPKVRSGFFGGLISKFESATGVGTSFKNRYAAYERWITHPLQRMRALSSGEAIIRSKKVESGGTVQSIIEDFYGGDYPEIVKATRRPEVTLGRKVDLESLSFLEKMKTLRGMSNKYEVVTSSSSKYYDELLDMGISPKLKEADRLIGSPPKGGFKILDNTVDKAGMPRDLGEGRKGGYSRFYTAPKSSVIPGITSVRDIASYMFYRVSHLASDTMLGISFAPAKTLLGNAARLAAIPMIYEAARQGINYADYLIESATGVSPIKAAATAYTKLRVLQQSIRETLGIQQTLQSAEDNYPGSVNSGLGTLLRSAVVPAGVFSALTKFGIGKAALGAAAVFGLIGGPSPDQSSEALKQEYAGEIKVPVRKGRWWSMGYTPWEGGEIERFDYSWYHKLQSDAATKSIYGSKEEYWKYHANVFGVPFPTPSNLLGLRNILNPYRLEAINYNTRPYEESAPALSEIPIFGPVLSETIGRLLKPKMYRQPDMPIYKAGLIPGGITAETAQSLGMSPLEVSDVRTDSLMDKLAKMANVAAEPVGVYKFVMEYFGVNLEPSNQQTATSANIDSLGKSLYAANLGGGLGMTEFFRRFMLSDYNSPTNIAGMVNRLPNNMPDWLPGEGSRFERDKGYSLNLQRGNPFDKLTQAEGRLPGVGYESLTELESGVPGQYSDVDKFLILADVAPYSQAYGHYEKIVSSMKLDEKWQRRVDLAKEYRRKVISVDDRYPRYTDDINALNKHIQDSSLYKTSRSAYDFVTHDILAEIPLLGSKLAPFRNPYEQYRKRFIEGADFASWYTPWEDIQRPALTDIALSNPIMGTIKGATIGALLAGPLSFAQPISMGPFSSITAGAIAGGTLSAGRIALGVPNNYVPEYVKKQSDVFTYLDTINYTKARALEELAVSQGADSSVFKKLSRKTMVGANTPIMLRASLPTSSDKKYFDALLKTPVEDRQNIMAGVAPHMASALNKAWNYNYNNQEAADQEAAAYLSDKQIPDFSSLTWNPMVDNKSAGFKIVTHGLQGVSDNYHKYGFYEGHELAIRTRMPDLWNESITFTSPPPFYSRKQYYDTIAQNIADSSTSSMFSTPYGSRQTYRLQIDRSNDTLSAVQGRF